MLVRHAAPALWAAVSVTLGQLFGLPAQPGAPVAGVPVALTSAESLIMTGTGMPDVTDAWMDFVSRNFIIPSFGAGYVNTPVPTPAQFWPITGSASLTLDQSLRLGWQILHARIRALIDANQAAGTPDDPITVFGYSQSAWLAAIEKLTLTQEKATGQDVPAVNFVMLANPIRPNGGLFSRFPGFRVDGSAVISAPTDTPFATVDIARQYDFFADFPAYPLNLVAGVNAVFGLLNHDYTSVTINPDDPRYDPATVVQQYGDTTYYLIPSALPMLQPLRSSGFTPVADFLEPVLTVVVELGYDRQASYGQPVPASPFPAVDPGKFARDMNAAVQKSLATLSPPAGPAFAGASQPPARPAATVAEVPERMTLTADDRPDPSGPPGTVAGPAPSAAAGSHRQSAQLRPAAGPDGAAHPRGTENSRRPRR